VEPRAASPRSHGPGAPIRERGGLVEADPRLRPLGQPRRDALPLSTIALRRSRPHELAAPSPHREEGRAAPADGSRKAGTPASRNLGGPGPEGTVQVCARASLVVVPEHAWCLPKIRISRIPGGAAGPSNEREPSVRRVCSPPRHVKRRNPALPPLPTLENPLRRWWLDPPVQSTRPATDPSGRRRA